MAERRTPHEGFDHLRKDDLNKADVPSIKLLLADDHRLLVDAMYTPLRHFGFDISVAHTYASALELVQSSGHFDVVLLDYVMPGMDGVDSITNIVNANTPGSVVLFSGAVTPSVVMEAIEEGAKGLIPKSLSLLSLESAVRLVANGEVFVPHGFLGNDGNGSRQTATSKGPKLKELELQVLIRVANGLSNKEIAFQLELTEVTVKMHMRSICNKLGAKNRTQAAMMGKRLQIV